MINPNKRLYDYYTFHGFNDYGEATLSGTPQGKIKMSINISSQATQDHILYKDCQYVGLTTDAGVNDTYVIQYGEERLKVLYVNPMGRQKQVYMRSMN